MTSTRVRLAPRLRRFSVARPWPATVFVVLEAEAPRPTCGWRAMASIRLVTPMFSISWASTTLTGVEASTFGRRMREPVTTMSATALASGAGSGASDCAQAGWAAATTAKPAIMVPVFR
ncbi:hypothetical protein D3C73_1049600 [compost metagenome]